MTTRKVHLQAVHKFHSEYICDRLLIIAKFNSNGINCVFGYDKDNDIYVTFDNYKNQGNIHSGTELLYTINPILAWDKYHTLVDKHMRKRIGDMLELQGKNRYTGEVEH